MTFEEKSGQYSLYECLKLTEEKYVSARAGFIPAENPDYPEFLAQARRSNFQYPLRRLVMDVSGFVRQQRLTGVGRVELELARRFEATAAESGYSLLFTAFEGGKFKIYELSGGNRDRFTPTGTVMQFRRGDYFLLVVVRVDVLEEFFTAIYQARRSGAVITYMIHDLIPLTSTGLVGSEEFSVNFFIGWTQVLRFADRLVTVSRKVARDVACYVSETSMAGLTLTRPLPVAYFTLGSDALLPQLAPGIVLPSPVDANTLVAAGTLMKHKGINAFVEAMQVLWAEGCLAKLVLLGGDMGKGNTRRYLSRLPVFGHQLFLPGYVSDAELAETLRRCGALVCPSLEEGFGLPLVEAAALGCPIIARDIEIFRETSGGNAFFFENGGVEEIAAGLRQWFKLTRKQQKKFVPRESLVTWRQSAEMLKAIMFQGASAFTVDVGVNATVNLAVPGSTKGIS